MAGAKAPNAMAGRPTLIGVSEPPGPDPSHSV